MLTKAFHHLGKEAFVIITDDKFEVARELKQAG